jgi:cytochrome P450
MSTLLIASGLLLAFPVAIIFWLIYRFFIKIYLDAYRYKKMDPNLKVFTYPIAGLPRVQKQCLEKYGDSHWFVKNMVKENPDQLAYLTNLGDKSFLVITDSQLVKEMSLEHKNFEKFKPFKHMDLCYLRGIFFAEGQDWKIQKELIAPAFNYEHLKRMIPIMMTTSKEAMIRRKGQLQQSTLSCNLGDIL